MTSIFDVADGFVDPKTVELWMPNGPTNGGWMRILSVSKRGPNRFFVVTDRGNYIGSLFNRLYTRKEYEEERARRATTPLPVVYRWQRWVTFAERNALLDPPIPIDDHNTVEAAIEHILDICKRHSMDVRRASDKT